MINIPNTNKSFSQNNQSDLTGNIFVTKNITFDKAGYIKLSSSSRAIYEDSLDADFGLPMAFLKNEDYGYLLATSDDMFEIDENLFKVTPSQVSTSGVPATDIESDMTYFEDKLVVTQDTDVDYYDTSANTWTDTNITLTADGYHSAVYMPSLSALAIADVYTVKLYAKPITATPTLITTLTIANHLEITSMCYFNQNLYIATQNPVGGHAWLYVWNGLGTSAQQVYEVDSNIIFSLCVHKNSVVLIIGNGSLLKFNGSGFTMLAGFPIFYTDQSLSSDSNKSMFHNALKSNGDLLYIGYSNHNTNSQQFLINQPDGIWCFDENTAGLYHRFSFSNARVIIESITSGNVNTSTDVITTTNNYPTGTEVVFNESFGIGGLTDGTKYFVINLTSTTIKLASTLANAQSSTAIDLTSVGGTNTFSFFRNTDFGQFVSERVFALYTIDRPVANRIYGTELLWGADIYMRDGQSDQHIGGVSLGVESRGYIITPKIISDGVTSTFNLVTIKFTAPLGELDKIIIKYRAEDDGMEFINTADWLFTWTSSTTFTTTHTEWANAEVGDEVEFLAGAGAGILAHITTISESGGTYTVTIDETYSNYVSGDDGRAIFRNWTKWQTITSANALGYLSEQLGATGKFLQLKIELRGIGVQIEEIIVDDKYHLPAKR